MKKQNLSDSIINNPVVDDLSGLSPKLVAVLNRVRFSDIKPLTSWGADFYDVSWTGLSRQLAEYDKDYGLDLDPDFQRGHVWTEAQQIAYIEFKLRGGKSGGDILLNCPAWYDSSSVKDRTMRLIDGKQRLNAVLRFMNNKLPAFGYLLNEYEDEPRFTRTRFTLFINCLQSRKEVLQWYLEVNAGTPHTQDELERVKFLLENEK